MTRLLEVTRPEVPAGLVAIPVRTRLVRSGDDLISLVAEAVRGIARPGDVLAVSETAVAIAQGEFVPAEYVRPSRLAYALSRRAGALATVNQPESLQLVIDRVGVPKVMYAATMHVLGRLRGKRGAFYEIMGDAITAIDGYTGTLPPYERAIVLAPREPDAFAQSVYERTGIGCTVVDANDLEKAKVLGASVHVNHDIVEKVLLDNPHGNGDEQTPIVVLKWRAPGESVMAVAVLTACIVQIAIGFVIAAIVGAVLVRVLPKSQFRQVAYEDAPETHQKKTGTPTMGGICFVVALLALLLQWNMSFTPAITFLIIACAAVGFLDDFLAIRRGKNLGLRARTKFLATALIAIMFLRMIDQSYEFFPRNVLFHTATYALVVPHWLWLLLGILAITGTIHAVNLTDGLDGLASGTIISPLAVFAAIAASANGMIASIAAPIAGTFGPSIATHQTLPTFTVVSNWHLPVTVIAPCLGIGACLGFLLYNRYPAKMIMGDTGSLALGGLLAGTAILTGEMLLLLLVGGVFVAEALSVIVQVGYFKLSKGKRILRMSPLHHHFELGGSPETSVTRRFWIASALCSLIGYAIVR